MPVERWKGTHRGESVVVVIVDDDGGGGELFFCALRFFKKFCS